MFIFSFYSIIKYIVPKDYSVETENNYNWLQFANKKNFVEQNLKNKF